MAMKVSSPSTSGLPSDVRTLAFVNDELMLRPAVSETMQLLDTASAVNTSLPVSTGNWVDLLMLLTLAELITRPLGPVLPCVLTFRASEVKRVAGPYWTR